MGEREMPSEQVMHHALTLYTSDDFKELNPEASEIEMAEDAASFAILDSIMDGRQLPSASIVATAELVLKLAKDIKEENKLWQ